MAYQTHLLHWHDYKLEIRFEPNFFNMTRLGLKSLAHIEVRTLEPVKAALPITETGYRSHFITLEDMQPYEDVLAFVTAWLKHAAESAEWKEQAQNSRQMSLF
ncbi:hypothetical protein [Paremcibacter congregatus]|uniref:hypothetical protein n=1 Tax=Paremcibacter congregatus TaxID=2043170 RepID=UPI003A919385